MMFSTLASTFFRSARSASFFRLSAAQFSSNPSSYHRGDSNQHVVWPDRNLTIETPFSCYQGNIVTKIPHCRDLFGNVQDNDSPKKEIFTRSMNQMLCDSFEDKAITIADYMGNSNGEVEFAYDPNTMKPIAVIVHEYIVADRLSHGSPVIFYHPRVSAMRSATEAERLDEKSYTGLGIIPAMMARFAFYLQLLNPTIPCYMAIPVYSPWVMRMVTNRFGISLPRLHTDKSVDDDVLNKELGLVGEVTKLLYGNVVDQKGKYPLYHLKSNGKNRVVNTKNYKHSLYENVAKDKLGEISDDKSLAYFCHKILDNGQGGSDYNNANHTFNNYGFLSIVPCSSEVLRCFLLSFRDIEGNYRRVFNTYFAPDTLFLDAVADNKNPEHPFMKDLEKLYHFNVQKEERQGLSSIRDYRLLINSVEHNVFDFERSNQPSKLEKRDKRRSQIPDEHQIDWFQAKPANLSGALSRTEILFYTKKEEKDREVKLLTEIYRTRSMPPSDIALLYEQMYPLIETQFSGGDFKKREIFSKRFQREHTYIEVIYKDVDNEIIGFVFHEPFVVQVKTKRMIEKEKESKAKGIIDENSAQLLKLVILKSGLGCLKEEYQQGSIIPFLIRRFMLRLQAEYENCPVYHHFIASSFPVLNAEYSLARKADVDQESISDLQSDLFLDGFYPQKEEDKIDNLRKVEDPGSKDKYDYRKLYSYAELFRVIFCAEVLMQDESAVGRRNLLRLAESLKTAIDYPAVPKIDKNDAMIAEDRDKWVIELLDKKKIIEDDEDAAERFFGTKEKRLRAFLNKYDLPVEELKESILAKNSALSKLDDEDIRLLRQIEEKKWRACKRYNEEVEDLRLYIHSHQCNEVRQKSLTYAEIAFLRNLLESYADELMKKVSQSNRAKSIEEVSQSDRAKLMKEVSQKIKVDHFVRIDHLDPPKTDDYLRIAKLSAALAKEQDEAKWYYYLISLFEELIVGDLEVHLYRLSHIGNDKSASRNNLAFLQDLRTILIDLSSRPPETAPAVRCYSRFTQERLRLYMEEAAKNNNRIKLVGIKEGGNPLLFAARQISAKATQARENLSQPGNTSQLRDVEELIKIIPSCQADCFKNEDDSDPSPRSSPTNR